MLAEPSIDITVQGQGEVTFLELVEALAAGRSTAGIAGTACRVNGIASLNPPREMQDMDSLAPPDYSLLPVERYFELKGSRQLDYISSIGCHFRCAFCADPFVYGRKWNAVAPERLGEQLADLKQRDGYTDVNFQDETRRAPKRKSSAGISPAIFSRPEHRIRGLLGWENLQHREVHPVEPFGIRR
jgi:radical SAM superfamily enzyme YgiQ (UPF0313 family)